AADGIYVLVNSIGGVQVPVLADPFHRRQNLDELSQFAGRDRAPALADVTVQRERLILGEDINLAQVGIDAIGEGYIDDAVRSAKGDCRLGTITSQGIETLPRAAR